MSRYDHGGDTYALESVQDFSICLNPFGAPAPVLEAAARGAAACGRYPDPHCRALTRLTAQRDGVAEETILWGNGAADLIYRIAFGIKPCKALILAPTFSEYRRALEGAGCQVTEYFLDRERNFEPDEGLLKAIVPGIEMVILCDPNNPTGRLMAEGLLLRVLARCREVGAVLVVDQCFLELTTADSRRLAGEVAGGSLILLRALTKSYALAGLRLGYCLCGDKLLREKIGAMGQPWPVSYPAQLAGEYALQKFSRWPLESAQKFAPLREEMARGLEKLGLWVCPGESCYLLFQGPDWLGARLLEQGYLLRDCANFSGLGPGWFRLGLRSQEENRALLAAMGRCWKGE